MSPWWRDGQWGISRASTIFRELIRRLESGEDSYPFYGVMLYAPTNGLDGLLHEYVMDHWSLLHHLTGEATLLLALERLHPDRPLDSFRPEEVYDIARHLGVAVDQLPALAIFTDPTRLKDIRVLSLREFLLPTDQLSDEELTDFFRSLVAALDSCSASPPKARLPCLEKNISKQWPSDSHLKERVTKAGVVLTASASVGATILNALQQILQIVSP